MSGEASDTTTAKQPARKKKITKPSIPSHIVPKRKARSKRAAAKFRAKQAKEEEEKNLVWVEREKVISAVVFFLLVEAYYIVLHIVR